jgi:hypothetical protein
VLKMLVGIVRNPKATFAARIAAGIVLWDRGHGKPAQMVAGDPERPVGVAVMTEDERRELARRIIDDAFGAVISEDGAKSYPEYKSP